MPVHLCRLRSINRRVLFLIPPPPLPPPCCCRVKIHFLFLLFNEFAGFWVRICRQEFSVAQGQMGISPYRQDLLHRTRQKKLSSKHLSTKKFIFQAQIVFFSALNHYIIQDLNLVCTGSALYLIGDGTVRLLFPLQLNVYSTFWDQLSKLVFS